MIAKKALRITLFFCAAIFLAVVPPSIVESQALLSGVSPRSGSVSRLLAPQAEPWEASHTIQPAELVKELGASSGSNRPVVVCVGFRALYTGAHVPGAVFHGAAQSESGLADLKRWAQGVPRSANLVIYCGCCPLAHCPNVRPAYTALRGMGFTNLRVLLLPHDFATDWVEKGYPVEKGAAHDSRTAP